MDSTRDRVDPLRNRMESQLRLPLSVDWSFLLSLTGLLIRSVELQVSLMVSFIKFPPWLIYRCFNFVLDPYGTIRRVRRYLLSLIVNICDFGLNNHKPVLKMLARLSWGLFSAVYVGIFLFALFASALMTSSFVMTKLVHKPVVIKESLIFDYTKNSPEAYVPITSCSAIGSKESNRGLKLFNPSIHTTEITISLSLPESDYNSNLGMFQVRLDFLSASGRVLATSTRPGIVRFRSTPIRLILTFLKIVPLVTGFVSETQTLKLKLKGFEERDIVPTACLKVIIEQRAEFLHGGAGIPEIYDASLSLESQLPFFKRIIWNWWRTLFVWISMSLFFVFVCFAHPRTGQRTQQRHTTSSINNNLDLDGQAASRLL